jgi:hypothetical protein
MRMRFAHAASLGSLLVACAAVAAPCPCGGEWLDPATGEVTARAVDHTRDDHCVCRCGSKGALLFMPPFQRDCARFEVECVDDEGQARRLSCEVPSS